MEIARIYKRPGDESYTPHYAVVPVLKYIPRDKIV